LLYYGQKWKNFEILERWATFYKELYSNTRDPLPTFKKTLIVVLY